MPYQTGKVWLHSMVVGWYNDNLKSFWWYSTVKLLLP